ncbi:MAG: hypothetical protein JEZ08_15815 [Clostridiales bacterium]|nr:hypothetical protein [Clostridiales bacterium]
MIILKVVLLIILYLFLFLLGLLLILLISPLKGYVRFDIHSLYLKVSYLFGIIKVSYNKGLTIRLLGFRIKNTESVKEDIKDKDKSEEKTSKDSKKKTKEKTKKKRSFRKPSREVIVLTLELLKKLIKKIAPNRAKCHLTLGLDDPYITEMMHIISIVFLTPLNNIEDYDFAFIPINDDIAIDYEGEAQIKFSIISLILPCLRYVLRKPIRQYFNITLKRRPRNN